MVTLPYREKVGEDMGGRGHKAGGLNMAEGMTERDEWRTRLDDKKILYDKLLFIDAQYYNGNITITTALELAAESGLRRAEEIAINAGKNALNVSHANMAGLIVEAIRAEREKLEGEQ